MKPSTLMNTSVRDVINLIDVKTEAAIEQAHQARANGNLDRVEHMEREATMWLAIREELDLAGRAL